MPVSERLNTQEVEAALNTLTSVVNEAIEFINETSEKVQECRNIQKYVSDAAALQELYQKMIDRIHYTDTYLQAAGAAVEGAARHVFMDFVLENYPICREGMQKLSPDAAIASTVLHQYRYIDPHLFQGLFYEAQSPVAIDEVDVEKAIRMDAKDLYALSILMRTYVYIYDMEESHPGYFFSLFQFFLDIREVLKTTEEDLQGRLEQLRSNKMKDLVSAVAQNPANEAFFIQFIDHLGEGCELARRFTNACTGMIRFYSKLLPDLADTSECINLAYQMYVDAQAPTF